MSVDTVFYWHKICIYGHDPPVRVFIQRWIMSVLSGVLHSGSFDSKSEEDWSEQPSPHTAGSLSGVNYHRILCSIMRTVFKFNVGSRTPDFVLTLQCSGKCIMYWLSPNELAIPLKWFSIDHNVAQVIRVLCVAAQWPKWLTSSLCVIQSLFHVSLI